MRGRIAGKSLPMVIRFRAANYSFLGRINETWENGWGHGQLDGELGR